MSVVALKRLSHVKVRCLYVSGRRQGKEALVQCFGAGAKMSQNKKKIMDLNQRISKQDYKSEYLTVLDTR